MEDLLGYIIPLLAFIGLFFGKNNDKKEKPPNRKTNEAPTIPESFPKEKENHTNSRNQETNENQTGPKAYYEQKQQQLEKVNQQIDGSQLHANQITDDEVHDAIKNDGRSKVKIQKQKVRKTNLSIAKNVSKKGLAESVVMAEILGPPRALKPYRNVVHNRKK